MIHYYLEKPTPPKFLEVAKEFEEIDKQIKGSVSFLLFEIKVKVNTTTLKAQVDIYTRNYLSTSFEISKERPSMKLNINKAAWEAKENKLIGEIRFLEEQRRIIINAEASVSYFHTKKTAMIKDHTLIEF